MIIFGRFSRQVCYVQLFQQFRLGNFNEFVNEKDRAKQKQSYVDMRG